MRWVLGYAAAVCVLVLLVCTSIAFPTFFQYFYSHEYDKYEVPETIQVQKFDLMIVTAHLLDYMHGRNDDLTVVTTVAGSQREFFNEKEKAHMVDVKDLFTIGFRVRNMTFWMLLLLILIMVFFKYNTTELLARCVREVLTGFLILSVVLVVVIALDFDRAFNIFHMLFFNNDLWQLNPATDLLVNIVPLGFFMDIAIFIGLLIAGLSLLLILLATLYLRSINSVGMFRGRK